MLAPTAAAAIGFRAVSELEGADAGGQHHVSVSSLGTIEQLPRPLASTLAPGLESEFEFDVVGPLLTDVGGTIAVRVLSTPGMVAVIERTCAVLSLQHLEQSKATVGFEICARVGADLAGMELPPEREQPEVVVAPAVRAGAMPGGEGGRLVEEEQLRETAGLQQRPPKPAA